MYLGGAVVCDLLMMVCAKKYLLTHEISFLVVLGIIMLVMGFFFVQMVRYEGIALANLLWVALSLVASTGVGVFLFHEKILLLQWIAIVIIIAGILLLELAHK